MTRVPYVAVCGAALPSEEEAALAEEVGMLLADAGAVVVCGGMGGVMDAAARGATGAGGTTVGILPGAERDGESRHLTVSVPTGMGEGRNVLVVRTADAVIAIGGEHGTLSEIALALKLGKPVVGLDTWVLSRPGKADPLVRASSAEEAVRLALQQLSAQ
jgi:uncharacterized protein (TIGR00725 family)